MEHMGSLAKNIPDMITGNLPPVRPAVVHFPVKKTRCGPRVQAIKMTLISENAESLTLAWSKFILCVRNTPFS